MPVLCVKRALSLRLRCGARGLSKKGLAPRSSASGAKGRDREPLAPSSWGPKPAPTPRAEAFTVPPLFGGSLPASR